MQLHSAIDTTMKQPTAICLFIALSLLSTVYASKDTKSNHMAFMMKPSGRELKLSIDVPLVSIDDTAYEVLRQEALNTTPSGGSSEENGTLETTTVNTSTSTIMETNIHNHNHNKDAPEIV